MDREDFIGEIIKSEDSNAYEEYLIGLKILKIKNRLKNNTLDINSLSKEDKMLAAKISRFLEVLPEEYHKCIGCWCNENDYPNCVECTFYKFCINKIRPYPTECVDGDCQKIRKRVAEIEK